ncbi:MAG: hypothetical protein STSR0008_24490 [Ignavibacterium sp.]
MKKISDEHLFIVAIFILVLLSNFLSGKIEYWLPKYSGMDQNYPNPFNPITKIKYTTKDSPQSSPKERTFVRLIVYDILGNEITTLVNEEKSAGEYEVEFNGKGLSSGIYLYKLEVVNLINGKRFVDTKKMILRK